MIAAKQLRTKSISEYVLYIWQIEDIIRAFGLDIEKIEQNIISRYADDVDKKAVREWYDNMISGMVSEQKQSFGHLQFIMNVVDDMNDLHMKLLQTPEQISYNALFFQILPVLQEFRAKNKSGAEVNDVDLALTALYGTTLLKISGKEVTKDTLEAIQQLAKWLNLLSQKYRDWEEDKLKFED